MCVEGLCIRDAKHVQPVIGPPRSRFVGFSDDVPFRSDGATSAVDVYRANAAYKLHESGWRLQKVEEGDAASIRGTCILSAMTISMTVGRPFLWMLVLGQLCLVDGTAAAQQGAAELGARLLATPAVAAALQRAPALESWVIERQVALCEVPAPPFKEKARAEVYRQAFQDLGLGKVRVDAVGNVIGERAGTRAGPHLVLSAHLDTVFPEGTDVRVVSARRPLLRARDH